MITNIKVKLIAPSGSGKQRLLKQLLKFLSGYKPKGVLGVCYPTDDDENAFSVQVNTDEL